MEIRRDPITQSWVVLGQPENLDEAGAPCPFDGASVDRRPAILSMPSEGAWQVRVIPHPDPLYRIEDEPSRLAEGMYDKMGALGAHEVVRHDERRLRLVVRRRDRQQHPAVQGHREQDPGEVSP